MKKTLFLLLVIWLISYSYQSECDDKEEGAKKVKDCKDLKVNPGMYKCCYVKGESEYDGKKEKGEGCQEIDETNYNRIKDYIKDWEDSVKKSGGKLDVKKFDCSSNYLLFSIMSLIILLFL